MALGLLGSAATMGIGLAVMLDDQFTQGASKISNTLTLMGKDLDDFSQGMQTLSSIGEGISRVGDRIVGFGMKASREFATFEHSINATRVIAGISKTDKGYKELGDTAERLSGIYGQLPDQIGNAELELAKGGKSVAQIKSMTEAVVALGAATQTEVGGRNGTSTVLLNIMQAYNAGSNEALHYADIITSAANQSTIDVRDLFESLRYSADVASTLKVPFEETATAIATLGNAGLKGSMAGTAYANMLRYLESGVGIFATKRQKTALGLLGLSKADMNDEQGHLISMSRLLALLRDRTKTFDDNNKLAVLGGIFGVRGNRATLNLLNGRDADTHGTMMSSFDAMRDKIHQDTLNNITQKTAKEMLDDTQGAWLKLSATWAQFKITIGSALAPAIVSLSKTLTTILSSLTEFFKGEMGQWVTRFVFGSGLFLSMIGRMIFAGARFAGYIVSSAGRITNAFAMANVAASSIRAQLVQGAMAIREAAMMAGATRSRFVPTGNGNFRDPLTGRFATRAARVEEAEALATSGRGLGWLARMGRWFTPLIEGMGWLTKTIGIIKVFGAGLGRALGWLFGWEGLLVDLGLTMLTGKGIFEWLWSGFRALFGWLFGWKDTDKEVEDREKKRKDAEQRERERSFYYDRRSDSQKAMDARWSKQQVIAPASQAPLILNFVVHPNNGTVPIKKQINIDQQRELQSHSIIQ